MRADDISEFEIEGISIGDSLLDHFNEANIKQNIDDFSTDHKFTMTCLSGNFKNYDRMCLVFRSNDKNYVIHSIIANLIYRDSNINLCYNKQKEIDDDMLIIFKNSKRKDWGILKLDPKILEIDPNATYKPITYDFKNDKERLQIACYDFEKEDRLRVILYTEHYGKHISSKAIKTN